MRPFIIEQTPEEMKLAVEFHQNALIENLRLHTAKVHAPFLGEESQPLNISFKAKSRTAEVTPGKLRVELAFRMEARAEAEKALNETPAMLVDCIFETTYSLRPGFEPSAAQVRAFSNGNALFNAWPYFREFLQNTLVRAGHPPLAAPFLLLRTAPPQKGISEQSSPKAKKRKSLPS